jgi:Cu(I)/Ag(I) efflux system membrane protein CusA/SilA
LVYPLSTQFVPGVAEVASVGGHVQQYQIDVDPNRLRAYSIPLSQVVDAVRRSNAKCGRERGRAERAMVGCTRNRGLIESSADIENIVIAATNGTPAYVR